MKILWNSEYFAYFNFFILLGFFFKTAKSEGRKLYHKIFYSRLTLANFYIIYN